MEKCINSSKVYCKLFQNWRLHHKTVVLIVAKCIVNNLFFKKLVVVVFVLIVAKCIVNADFRKLVSSAYAVLIVAKCIVNLIDKTIFSTLLIGINSSKVYCKCA